MAVLRDGGRGVGAPGEPRGSVLGAVVLLAGGLTAVVLAVVLVTNQNSGGGDDAAATGGLTGPDFHSLVADPANPERVFVGGHQAVSVSTDGGRTWREVATLRDADAMGWALVDGTVYVSGHPGLNRSTDGGRTFERVNEGLPHTDVHAFGGTTDVLYGASPGAGVFASTTGIPDWEVRTDEAGQAFFGRMVVDPDDPRHVLAADARAGVVESRDGGRTWRRLDTGLPAATWLSTTPDLAVLVASGPAGAVRSNDGGRSWRRLDRPEGASLVEVASGDGSVLYAGRHRGSRVELWVSGDRGRQWQPARASAGGMREALCTAARAAAAGDTDASRRAFFDGAHQPLHELASKVADHDRAVAARLLEAKEAVESAFDEADVAVPFDELLPAVDDALAVAQEPGMDCPADQERIR